MTSPIDFNAPTFRFPIQNYVPAGAPRPPLSPNERSYQYERTEMCHDITELGGCIFGDKCSFAHCIEEIDTGALKKHPNHHRDLCRNFFGNGICYYGTRCRFSHSIPYAHSLGYMYDPSIPGYVKLQEIPFNNQKSTSTSKIVDCWAHQKPKEIQTQVATTDLCVTQTPTNCPL